MQNAKRATLGTVLTALIAVSGTQVPVLAESSDCYQLSIDIGAAASAKADVDAYTKEGQDDEASASKDEMVHFLDEAEGYTHGCSDVELTGKYGYLTFFQYLFAFDSDEDIYDKQDDAGGMRVGVGLMYYSGYYKTQPNMLP